MANNDPQNGSDPQQSDSQNESVPEQAGEERKDAGQKQEGSQREGSESRPLREMKKPYRGPEGSGGISAHGIEGETDLRRAKEYAEMIVDTVREGLLVLNFELRVEAANESFYRMFEVGPGETEGRFIYELGSGQWDIPELHELLEEILPEKKVMTGFEVTHEFENVGQRILRLNARQLDHHQRILLSIEDITEGEEAKERLRASEEKLRKLNRSLEKRVQKRTAELQEQTERLRHLAAELASAEQRERRRLASLLHDDLQQLLYGAEMKLGTARGKTERDAAAIEEASEQINQAVEAARNLTRQLRPPALYESGLTPALEWLASDMDERYDLEVAVDAGEMKSDTVERSMSDDIKALLYECARELLFNVVKYAGVGEAHLSLSVDTTASETLSGEGNSERRLHLAVEDEGRGFDAEQVFRGDSGEGGFGLFSIRERIAALGGSMEIESSPEKGTRVELALPLPATLREEPPQRALPDKELEESQPKESFTKESLTEEGLEESQAEGALPPQVRVAVADDHAVVREGIANLIAGDDRMAVVGEAASGREATQLVEQERPDVVLMDVNMPEMNGIEATREIRRRWPETNIIGISVQADRATERSMLEAGAEAFSPKSGDADQIIDTILQVRRGNSQSGK